MVNENIVLSLNNPLLRTYLFYSTLLGLKMLFMSFFTAFKRAQTKTFLNPEDASHLKGKVGINEEVERIRRAHLNDLENITVFFIISFVFVLSNPPITLATMFFRIFAISRFLHTFVYAIVVIPQPARALAFAGGYGTTGLMGLYSLFHFIS